jgi:glycosyltransferase involved in cell wall biosynthesis
MSPSPSALADLQLTAALAVKPARVPRVMHVVLNLSPGGTERLVIDIARRLQPHTEVSVCCLEETGAWAGELAAADVPVMALGRRPGFHPRHGFELARLARARGVEVLHCHQYSPFVYGQIAALVRPSLRVVFTEHGRLSDAPPSGKRKAVNPWLGRLPARIFAVSADLRRHMVAEGFPARRIEVLYNGIEVGPPPTGDDRQRARRALAVDAADLLVGTVGRLDPVKDLRTLITATAMARSAGRPWRLVIVGDGAERAAIADLVHTLGLSDVVGFAGYRGDVRELLPAFDIYANSSIHEGVSLTILEAMAASLPVVATQVGGNPEVVLDRQTGILVPPRDASACFAAIQALADDGARRTALGRNGRCRVLDAFTVDRMMQRYLQAYRGGAD